MKKINFILVTLLLIIQTQPSCATPFQSIASIHQAVRQYITTNLNSSTDYKFKLGKIDHRLKLPICTEALEISTPRNSLKAGRNSIGVRCNSKKKWAIYTSAIISIYKNVIVLSSPIQRGELYSANNLMLEQRNIANLRSGFFTNQKNIINKQASRNLNSGTVISQSNITEPKLIRRGEKVTINISSPNLTISAAGIALMDGIKNQNIKIKNLTSRKTIQATVVKQGQVVVTF